LSSFDKPNFRDKKWINLKREVESCYKCKLHSKGIFPIFGEGSINSKVIFIGEAPGAVENKLKRPFVGPSGQLLREYLLQINLSVSEVFITNIVKCHPPSNRDPFSGEISVCSPFLTQQIELMNPEIIVTLGRFAARFFIDGLKSITAFAGKILPKDNFSILPMFHPATCLYNRQKYDPIFKRDFYTLKNILNSKKLISNKEGGDKKKDSNLIGLDRFLNV
jgi:uracil-DNA glycosylase family 4